MTKRDGFLPKISDILCGQIVFLNIICQFNIIYILLTNANIVSICLLYKELCYISSQYFKMTFKKLIKFMYKIHGCSHKN